MTGSDKKMRDTINALQSVPGEPLDKDAAWQKLQFRMGERKTTRSSRKYYYMAAACMVVLLLGYQFLFLHKERGEPLPLHPAVVTKTGNVQPPEVKQLQPQPQAKVNAGTAITKKVNTINATADVIIETPVGEQQTGPEPLGIPVPSVVEVAAVPVKAIHINELDDAPQQQTQPPPRNSFATIMQQRQTINPQPVTTGNQRGLQIKF